MPLARTKMSLEEQILRAFKQAYAEGEYEVAEHLLRVLETLNRDPLHGPSLGEACLMIRRR